MTVRVGRKKKHGFGSFQKWQIWPNFTIKKPQLVHGIWVWYRRCFKENPLPFLVLKDFSRHYKSASLRHRNVQGSFETSYLELVDFAYENKTAGNLLTTSARGSLSRARLFSKRKRSVKAAPSSLRKCLRISFSWAHRESSINVTVVIYNM